MRRCNVAEVTAEQEEQEQLSGLGDSDGDAVDRIEEVAMEARWSG